MTIESAEVINSSSNSLFSCFVFVSSLYAIVVVVSILCPAKLVEGYVCDPLWLVLPDRYEDYHSPHRDNYHKRIKPLVYSLNGFRCFGILVVGFLGVIALHYYHWLQVGGENHYDTTFLFLHQNYGRCSFVSNLLGLLLSYYFVYVRFPQLSPTEQKANAFRRAPTVNPEAIKKKEDDPTNKSNCHWKNGNNSNQHNQCLDIDQRGTAFFYGKEFNPRYELYKPFICHNENTINGNEAVYGPTILDVKMTLYLVGAIVLELNVISALLYERHQFGNSSNASILYSILMTWFVMDYLWYEQVHLYTYDLFAEKIGFKLVWGCLCFYPFFYPIGMLPLTARSIEDKDVDNHNHNFHQDLNVWSALLITLTYMVGSCLTRGANLQKYYFRRYPHKRFVTLFGGMLILEQKTISSSSHILCSGFWGLARHINYCGEIIQAVALALPAYWCYNGPSLLLRIVPWLYPLYYVALFLPRQYDDETLMRQKYGDKVMAEYIHRVPSRIIPGLY